ncbi:transposase [Lacticaseibacillus sp. GG6-2]
MTKYSSKFKIEVVSAYLKGGIGYDKLCVRFEIPSTKTIRTWVTQAQAHGIGSLAVKRTKTKYSQAFKITVLEYVHTHKTSEARTAAHFGISPGLVNSWNHIVREQGVVGLRAKRAGGPSMGKHKKIKSIKRLEPTQEEKYKQEILELKSKLHKAEMDRDILKVLATLTKNSSKHSPRK